VTTAVQPRFDPAAADTFNNVPLVAHSREAAGPVHALSASGALHRSGTLTVEFELRGDLQSIRLLPSVCQPRRRDELWKRTCFELFARHRSGPRYCEFNFSACGDWAAYVFDSYRGTRHDAEQRPLEISVLTTARQQIRLRARMDLRAAYAGGAEEFELAGWRLNCAAVIENAEGSLSHWAVRHPRPRPDFHDTEGFAICLDGAVAAADSQVMPS